MNIGKYKRAKRTYVIYFRVSNFSFIKEIVWGGIFWKIRFEDAFKILWSPVKIMCILIKEILIIYLTMLWKSAWNFILFVMRHVWYMHFSFTYNNTYNIHLCTIYELMNNLIILWKKNIFSVIFCYLCIENCISTRIVIRLQRVLC